MAGRKKSAKRASKVAQKKASRKAIAKTKKRAAAAIDHAERVPAGAEEIDEDEVADNALDAIVSAHAASSPGPIKTGGDYVPFTACVIYDAWFGSVKAAIAHQPRQSDPRQAAHGLRSAGLSDPARNGLDEPSG